MASPVTVATLFTDLVDSTAVSVRLGPEASEALRREHYGVLRSAVWATGGSEVKSTGDGLMVVFGTASAAVACAVEMQQALEHRNRAAAEPLQVRMGISIGEAEPAEGDYYGQSVVEAARLCATAEGGEILATEMVRGLAGGRGGHVFERVGPLVLKGWNGQVAACRVRWVPVRGAGWSVPFPLRLRALEGSSFVGRTAERAALRDTLKQTASDGERKVVLLGGEAGIGKTALVSAVARDVHTPNAVVLYGRCDEDLGIPYQPWVEAVGDLVEHAPAPLLRAHAETRGGDLLALTPGLAARIDEVPVPRSADRDTERHLLFAATVDLLRRVAAETPVLLVLEDLHWADRPTLQLLRHIVAASTGVPLMVLGTFRATDVGADDPLAEALAALHREPGVERLTLHGLDDDEVLALMQAAAGHEMTAEGLALRDALVEETDGNPFFVLEILRHLAEIGVISRGGEGLWVAHLDLSVHGLPTSVREVIGRRVGRLGAEATRALLAASVIGRDFDVGVLSAVLDTGEDELIEVLDRAAARAVIADAPGTAGRFSFVHALIQRALYDELTTAHRQRLHRRIADALETLPGDHDERLGELAHHWYAATPPAEVDKALGYSMAAGDRAQNRLAPDEAVRWYVQALELVERLDPDTQDEQRCDVLVRLGTAQRLAGAAEFRQTLLDAASHAQRLGDTDRMVMAALTNTRGTVAAFGDLDVDRIAVLRAALDAVGSSSPGLRAQLLAQWAIETIYSPEYDTEPLIAEALTLTDGHNDPQARWHALQALYLNFIPQNVAERCARQSEYLDLTRRLDPSQQFWIFDGCLHLAMQSGQFEQARAFLGELDRLAQAVSDPAMGWLAQWMRAALAMLNGDIAVGEQHLNEAMQIGLDSDQPDALVVYGGQLIDLRILEGREAQICDFVAEATAEHPGLPAFRAALANLLAASNRLGEARALLDDFVADADSLWTYPLWAPALQSWAEAAGRTRHVAAAQSIAPLLEPYADQWAWSGVGSWGPVALGLGISRAVLRDYDHAERDFAQALDMAQQAHAPYYAARTQLEWANMLADRAGGGDGKPASTLLSSALDIARKHGFTGIERSSVALRKLRFGHL